MKAKFEKLKIELLPKEIADKFLFIKNKTDNFTKSKLVEMSKDNFNSLYDIVEKNFPQAIEGYKAPEPEIKKKKIFVKKEIKDKISKPAKKTDKKKQVEDKILTKAQLKDLGDDKIRLLLKKRSGELQLPPNWGKSVKNRNVLISLYLGEYSFSDYKQNKGKLPDVKYTHIENSDDETLQKAKKLLDADDMKLYKKDKPKLKRKPRSDAELNKENISSIIKRGIKDLPEEKKAKVKETELTDVIKTAISSALNQYRNNL